jgi:aerobic-type carbon monoxide dehydrogenase small subunit (CoxS/CutS family)
LNNAWTTLKTAVVAPIPSPRSDDSSPFEAIRRRHVVVVGCPRGEGRVSVFGIGRSEAIAMSTYTLKVNGTTHTVDVEPATPLLYVLRDDLDLRGPRFGCGLGQCGACTVIIEGEAVRSCIKRVATVGDAEITTLEGLSENGTLHPVQQAWIDEQVPQCGFCQNGQILTAKVLLDNNPAPTDAEIREAMDRTLCRCMTYYRVQAAIKRAASTTAPSAADADGEA